MDGLYIQHSLKCCGHNFKLPISPNFSFQFLAVFFTFGLFVQQQQQSASFDMENSLWYNQFSYNEEPGPSWNPPATAAPPCNSTSATPPSSMPWPLPETVSSSQTGSTSGSGTGTGSGNNLAHDNEQDSYAEHHRDSSLIMGLSDNSLEKSPMSKANKGKPMKSSYLLGRPLWDFKFCSLLKISDRLNNMV